jgi:hypothetical protein
MKIGQLRIIRNVLGDVYGYGWPLLMFRAVARKRQVLSRTQWGQVKSRESDFVKRFALSSAIYLELIDRLGKHKAFEAMRRIMVPIGCNEQWSHMKSLKTSEMTPMGRLTAFNHLMDEKGAPQFNRREYVECRDDVCHFIITRCVFYDFFVEAGTPELTELFCEVDRAFFPEAFPEFDFHRGESWENTIACGKEYCTFIFEQRSHST